MKNTKRLRLQVLLVVLVLVLVPEVTGITAAPVYPTEIHATNFYLVSNGMKGAVGAQIKIRFENWGASSSFNFRVKIESTTYTDWNHWLLVTYSGSIGSYNWLRDIPAVSYVTITLPTTFAEGNFGDPLGRVTNRYAFNTGSYKATTMYTWWSTGARTDNIADLSFSVNGYSYPGKPKVFAAVYYDQEFLNLNYIDGISAYFNEAINHEIKKQDSNYNILATYSDGLEGVVYNDYILQIRTWAPPSSYDTGQALSYLINTRAEEDLGLANNWNVYKDYHPGIGYRLTNFDNHGYDCIIGLSGRGPYGVAGGMAYWPGNAAVVQMRSWNDLAYAKIVLVHELSHNYGASHTAPIYCIMNDGPSNPGYPTWFSHYTGNIAEMTSDYVS
ncbi:MAG: hypothetical protein ACFFD4_02650 [Candidatus Odinarchaeota archaeon]